MRLLEALGIKSAAQDPISVGDCFLSCPRSSGVPPISSCHYEVVSVCAEHADCYLMACVDHDERLEAWQQLDWCRGRTSSYHTAGESIRSQMQPYSPSFRLTGIGVERRAACARWFTLEDAIRARVGPPPVTIEMTTSEYEVAQRTLAAALGREVVGAMSWDGLPIKIVGEVRDGL